MDVSKGVENVTMIL